jgi:DNA-directed RNA polymerase subunit RPC12/RpoP
MPRGVYPRDTMSRPYHGFKRLRMVRDSDGKTAAIVAVECDTCGAPLERTAGAVKLAKRQKRGFTCTRCNTR